MRAMRQVIAEQLQQHTGAIIGARTVEGTVADCRLVGDEIVIGIVDIRTEGGWVCFRVSADVKDYQRARIYEDGQIIESLLVNEDTVVYVDDAASPKPSKAGNGASS
jgi:hypothetical protein